MRRFECWWKWTKELKNKKQNKSRKRLKWLIHGNCIVTAILCWFHFFPKHVIISSTGKMTEQIWDVSADIVLKKKIVIRSISWPAVPLWSLLLLLLLTCFYSSPSNTRSSHCDGWMDEGKGGGSRPLQAQVSLRHLLLSTTSPHPAPSLALPLPPPRPLSPLCPRPRSPIQIGFAQEWPPRERGRVREGLRLAPFHLSRLKDQVIGFCLRIEDNCSLYSAP